MLYSASRRQKVGSVSLIAPGQSSSTHYVSRACGPLLHSFRFTRPRNLFIFNRSHTLVFEPSATHSFPMLCALFQKHRGGYPFPSQNGTHSSVPALLLLPRPLAASKCAYTWGSSFSARFRSGHSGRIIMNARNLPGFIRLVLAGTIIVLAAYWVGARYGQRQPLSVEAVRPNPTAHEPSAEPSRANSSSATDTAKPTAASLAERDAILTDDEGINVKVYRSASPAVANILTKATEYDFFMDPVPVEGAGSGFVIDERGYILTNFHVVQEAQSIEVVLGDQTRYPGKFIGADQRNDVALVKIDPKGKHLTALPLGDSSKLQVGQKVLAIGNPFGFQSTLTTGVVSALGRTVQTSQTTLIDEAIQTDAAIN